MPKGPIIVYDPYQLIGHEITYHDKKVDRYRQGKVIGVSKQDKNVLLIDRGYNLITSVHVKRLR